MPVLFPYIFRVIFFLNGAENSMPADPGETFAFGQLHSAFGAFSNTTVALCYKNPLQANSAFSFLIIIIIKCYTGQKPHFICRYSFSALQSRFSADDGAEFGARAVKIAGKEKHSSCSSTDIHGFF